MAILFGRNQLPVFISFLICGIISGIVYDLLRIKRRIIPINGVVLFFDDVIFMLFNAVLVLFNAYAFNNGNLKWYEFPFLLTGFSLYRLTLSVIFINLVFKVIDAMKVLISKCILKPAKNLLSKLKIVFLNLCESAYFKLLFLKCEHEFRNCKIELKQIS